MRIASALIVIVASVGLVACGNGDDGGNTATTPANVTVRQRIAALAPAANLAHRGNGLTRAGHALPENSLAAFRAGIAQGADAIEMDAELTLDGKLVLMHDDTVDRTSECRGCVSALSFDALRRCRLLDGDGQPTDQVPPTLDEVFQLPPADILVNVELKIFGAACRTPGHGPVDIARAMVAEIRRLGVASRTLLSSFDEEAIAAVKAEAPELYTAFLVSGLRSRDITTAVGARADSIQPGGPFPFLTLPPDLILSALNAGLQVVVWTVDDTASMNTLIDNGINGIITDEPAVLREVLRNRRR